MKRSLSSILKTPLLALLMLVLGGWALGQTTHQVNINTSGNYSVPQGVTSITVEAWGGGGGGGGAKATGYILVWQTRSGSGGGGSAYARSIIAAPFSSPYNITVGAGGTSGQNADGGNGGDTLFGNSVKAVGGKGGKRNAGTAGAGGDSGTSIGNNKYSGGNGAAGDNAFFEYGGGGGGSAGGGGVGGSASQSTGGTAGVAGGFSAGAAGAAGATNGINGTPGSAGTVPGSGGSGGKIIAVGGTYSVAGGAGAKGLIKISFAKPVISISPSAITICRGASATLTASSAGAYTYTWSNGAGSGATVSVSPTTTTTYTVTGTAPDGAGGTFTNTQTITVNVVDPVADITFTQTSYPSGATACNLQYMEITTNLPVSYSPATGLYTNAALTTPYTGGNVTEIFAAPTGSVTYTATASNGYCSKTNTVTVVRTPVTPVSITSTVFPNGADACTLDYVQLTANQAAVFSPTTGLYTNTALTTLYTGTPVTTVYAAPNGAQSYTASVTSGSCSSVSSSVSVSRDKKVFLPPDGTWKKTSNWFPGGEPNADKCVRIPNGKTVKVNTDAFAKSLEVENGAGITIEEDQSLTVTQNITNLGNGTNFIVASDANLIQIEDGAVNTGNITALRTMTWSNNRKEYNFLASPVAGQNMKELFGAASNTPYATVLNETTNYYVNASSADYLVKGKGFAVKEPISDFTSTTATYKGEPNNGIIHTPIRRSAANRGWNLVGNPYPSNINLNALYADNSTKIESTFRFWDNTTNSIYVQQGGGYNGVSYAIYNAAAGSSGTGIPAPGQGTAATGGSKTPNGIVKPTQGFLIRAVAAGSYPTSATLDFRNSIRLSDQTGTVYYGRQAGSTDDRYQLESETPSGLVITQAVVYFGKGSNSFGIDDSQIPNSSASDLFYSFAGETKAIINGRSTFNAEDVVSLGTRHYAAGSYTIRAVDLQGVFASGQAIYLKDRDLNTLTDLTQGGYTFYSDTGDYTNRFEIVYRPESTLATDTAAKDALKVYRSGSDFVIRSEGTNITGVEAYDMSGRLVKKVGASAREVVLPDHVFSNGVYILKIWQGTQISTKKIIK
ncbi:T9SS type A sorting domain-containing protein [Weeksellaceae bacterium A-14]